MANWLLRDELITSLFDATLGDEGWSGFLRGLCAATSSQMGVLNLEQINTNDGSIFAWHGIEAGAIRKYNEHFAMINPYLARGSSLFAPGFVGSGRQVVADSVLLRSEFYNDFLAPEKLRELIGGPLFLDPETACVLTLGGAHDRLDYSPDDLELISSLMPQTQAALQAWRRLKDLRRERDSLSQALDAVGFGVAIFNAQGRMLSLNLAARHMVDRRDGLAFTGKTLSGSRGNELQRAIGLAVRRAQPRASSLLIPRSPSGSYGITVLPLRSSDSLARLEGGAAVVLIADPNATRPSRDQALAQFYGLSRAESQVLTLLLRGSSVEETAGQLEVGIPTVRTHVRRLFARFEVSRQTDLIRKALLSFPMVEE